MKRFTILIPTLGERLEYLDLLCQSLSGLDDFIEVIIICRETDCNKVEKIVEKSVKTFRIIFDPGKGLANALNLGIKKLETEFWTWIGDDDLLESENYFRFLKYVSNQKDVTKSNVSVFYAGCSYISDSGKLLAKNFPKHYAKVLIFYGPNLFPQPSLIFRTDLTRQIGGLNESRNFAFDQELIMNLVSVGDIELYSDIVTYYRWHKQTLTAKNRYRSFEESYRIRLEYSQSILTILINKLLFVPTYLIVRLYSLFFTLRSR